VTDADEVTFRAFVLDTEPRLHRALVGCLGWERGREATAEALAYAWEHWDKIRGMVNPAGYLYRVGQSRVRRPKTRTLFQRPDEPDSRYEPALAGLLADLTQRQRVVVVLIHGFGWTAPEVSEFTGLSVSTVHTHLERALAKLRSALEVADYG